MAELKIITREPGAISFNFEELKTEIESKTQEYEVAVYSAENIGAAKTDRAKLNKLKTTLNEERLKREREFMEPFMEFKNQVAELIRIIDKPIKAIDTQVKAFEEEEKNAKRTACIDAFNDIDHPDWLKYEQIENPKWYNKTTTMKDVKAEINNKLVVINSDLSIIKQASPDIVTSEEYYKLTLNLADSLSEGRRAVEIATKKEQMAKVTLPEGADEEEAEWVSFKALLTPTLAKALAGFMKLNGIKFTKGD